MSYSKKLDRPYVLAVGDGLGKGVVVLGLFLSSLILSKGDFASISFAYSLISSAWFLLDFGINIKATRYLVKSDRQRYKSFSAVRTLSALLCLLCIITLVIFSQFVLALFVFALFFRLLSYDWLLRARLKYYFASVSMLVSSFLFGLSLILIYVAGEYNAIAVGAAYSLMFFSYFVSTRYFSQDFHISRPTKRLIGVHLGSSITFSLSGFVVSLLVHLPMIVLGLVSSEIGQVAKLGFAILLISSSQFLISIYVVVMFPLMARNVGTQQFNYVLVASGILFSLLLFVAFVGAGAVTDYHYDYFESTLMSVYILMYSIRRIFDSKVLINKGERLYLNYSIIVLATLAFIFSFCIFYMGYSVGNSYGLSIVCSEILFVLLLSNAYRKKN